MTNGLEIIVAVVIGAVLPIYIYLLRIAKSHGEMNIRLSNIEKTLKNICYIKVRR